MIETIKAYALLLKIAAAVLLVIAGVWWWHSHNTAQQQIGYNRASAEYAAKLAEAKDAARNIEKSWFLKYERAANDRTNLENKIAQYRAAAAAADDRLRIATEDWRLRLSVAPLDACRQAAGTAAELLGECSAAYRQVAAAADGHAADVRQCENSWPGQE